ncbi:hypothetical protein ACC783_23710 [Rhizobium ruizarguesonis]
MAKGGRMKVVWPRGKNLKPLPAGKDLQAIPEVMKRAGVLQLPSTADHLADLTAYKATTATDPRMAPAPVTAARLREMLASMPPAPEPEPLLLTREEMETLRDLYEMVPDPTLDPKAITFRGLPVTIIEGNPTPATRALLARIRNRTDLTPKP